MMIHRLQVENFMSLKNVSVDLDPLTVFIGPNASGKSAIFKSLVLLSKLLNGTPVRSPKGELIFGEPGVTLDDLVWNGDSGLPIRFRVWISNKVEEEPDYSIELRKRTEGWSVTHERIRANGTWIEVDEETPFEHPTERKGTIVHTAPMRATLRYLIHPYINDTAARSTIDPIVQFAAKFGHAWRYRPSAIDIASFVRRPTERGRNIYVAENGWGVAATLQDLHNSPADRKVFEAIETALCQLFPHIKAIGFENDFLGVRLSFRTDRSYDPVRAPQESDGVLLATFLLWRLHTISNDFAVCLEEPENGLHPVLLADRFRLLKNIASGGRQVLVSTHSPEFMRVLKAHPAELYKEVRLTQFEQSKGTCIESLHHYRDATKLLEKYQVEMHDVWEPIIEKWDSK